ncbi:MAG TPA: uracil-DNA glycosylase [Actinomycetota bacterium]|nr:uracil-DNA glycosylase [Actinomycetota bacterium]
MDEGLPAISAAVVSCRRCPRLVAWREAAAAAPPARFRGQTYWARPVPGFGDPAARLLIVGLAPAANGGNRTGRIFTGDPSGDWLYRALHRAGFANQPTSRSTDDGLVLTDCYVTAVVRCAPPDNKPLPEERDRCLGYLSAELAALPSVEVILALGGFGWDGVLRALGERGRGRPLFGHGAVAPVGAGRYQLLGSYHPSQRNTATGLLSEAAFDMIFTTARRMLGLPGQPMRG